MRAMETTPAAPLNAGKEQGNRSSDAHSEGQPGDSLCKTDGEWRRTL